MINTTSYQPANQPPVQSYSPRGGQHGWNNYQPQPHQNNQLQQLLNLLLPLLQQLIGNLGNNPHCDHTPPNANELNLSNDELGQLTNALTGGRDFPGSGPSVTGVKDNDNSGGVSLGDTLIISEFDETTGRTDISEKVVDQAFLDQLNGTPPNANELNLSNEELGNLTNVLTGGAAFAGGSGPSVTGVKDNDNSGGVSLGDTLIFSAFSETTGRTTISERTVDQAFLDQLG